MKKKSAKPLSASDRTFIANQAKKSNFSPSTLTKVLRRGRAAYLSSGSRPGISMEAWSRGRVRSFVSGKGGARKADSDLIKNRKK